jgi:hypothetical protein
MRCDSKRGCLTPGNRLERRRTMTMFFVKSRVGNCRIIVSRRHRCSPIGRLVAATSDAVAPCVNIGKDPSSSQIWWTRDRLNGVAAPAVDFNDAYPCP